MPLKYVKKYLKKINCVKHRNWSAPAIMSAFLIICMIIVFSFESLGLTNKEKNLKCRQGTPEKMIKILSEEIRKFGNEDFCKPDVFDLKKELFNNNLNLSVQAGIDYIEKIKEKEINVGSDNIKELNRNTIIKILREGAEEQIKIKKKLGVIYEDELNFKIDDFAFEI